MSNIIRFMTRHVTNVTGRKWLTSCKVQSYKGKSYVFVNQLEATLSELQCPICQQILQDPLQTSCEHLFCKHCLLEALQRRPRDCPLCRQRHTHMKDAFNQRKIGNLQVKCPKHAKGCLWVEPNILGLPWIHGFCNPWIKSCRIEHISHQVVQ